MILAIDIGNTTVALCGLEDGRVCFKAHILTAPDMNAAQCGEEMCRAFGVTAGTEQPDFEAAVITSVVPALTPVLAEACMAFCREEPLIVHRGLNTGLTLAVDEPDGVGVDRIVDAAAAAALYPLPVITVDMGTCTTFNVVDEERRFLGGVIAPGLCTSLDSLSGRTAQLPRVQPEPLKHTVGKNTTECILSGTVLATAVYIDGLASRMEEELGKPATLILTGGLSKYVEPYCRHPHIRDEHLMMKGLHLLYLQNR